MSLIDRRFFFSQVRGALFADDLHSSQVNGLNALLDGWETKYAEKDKRWLAYALATAYHETAKTMQPIEEFGKARGKPYGKPYPATGQVYYGRGFVQLTWYYNYNRMTELLGVDLLHHPELALKAENATNILFIGMIDGIFTERSLANYFGPAKEDWTNARRIINGVDRAQAIATYGRCFSAALGLTRSLPVLQRRASGSRGRPAGASARPILSNRRALTAAAERIDPSP
jgi:hypothetical protein